MTAAAPADPTRRRHLARLSRPIELLVASLLAALVAPAIAAIFYPGSDIWPLVITAYSGASLAFLTALAWDRHSRMEADARQHRAEERRQEERLREEQERREVEAKRRFSALELELLRLKESIDRTKREQQAYKYFFPDLPTGTWESANGPLALIVSDYELMADLSTFYGHVEELRWRLRFKAETSTDEAVVSPLIDTFVGQMVEAVNVLLGHVREQVDNPQVEHIVGAPETHRTQTHAVVRKRQFTGAIRTQTPEELARGLADHELPGLEGAASRPGQAG
jgi:hypothetical protein